MAIITDITKLSQTPELNGPDGAVDPPSSLDDQDRYLGSFIAKLRDGVGYSAGAAVAALGFTPVKQGGASSGTTTNTVSIGWNGTSGRLVCAVDSNQFSNKWPIDTTGDAGSVNGQVFSWSNPSNSPAYVWAANANGSAFLSAPGGMTVSRANSAGTADNAGAVNGISGWSYSNQANNPAYIWCTEGSAGAQHLTQPGNLSVNYANSANTCNRAGSAGYADSAGSAPANGGTSSNSNQLGGIGPGGWVQNSGGLGSLGLSGYSLVNGALIWIASNASDETIKENIAPTQEDSLGKLLRIKFKQFTFKDEFKVYGDGLQKLGVVAQQLQTIDPQWIVDTPDTLLHPSQYNLLMTALHAIQQLADKVKVLQAKLQGAP